jgi:hypothetical protein
MVLNAGGCLTPVDTSSSRSFAAFQDALGGI